MSILHTVNKSPFEKNALSSCLKHSKAGDGVLLIEDAVYGALKGTSATEQVTGASGAVSLYVLGEDLAARGLGKERLIEGIEVVDYGGFVDLVAKHDTTQAWL